MEYDALILAGGQSSRLGGVPKAGLLRDGATLLEHAIGAARGARRIVVVGPPDGVPADVLHAREDPPFSGPAAAIAAGLAALSRDRTPMPFTLVLACDMPLVHLALPVLLTACTAGARSGTSRFGGAVAASPDGRRQPLAAFYDTELLQQSAGEMASQGKLRDGSVRALLANLDVVTVPVPAGSTDDVDTWADAQALGVARTQAHNGSGRRLDEATLEANGEDAGPDS